MRIVLDGVCRVLSIGAALLVSTAAVRADDMTVTIQVRPLTAGFSPSGSEGKDQRDKAAPDRTVQTKRTRLDPFGGKRPPRVVFHAKQGELLLIKWTIKHDGGDTTLRNVLVHFFVDAEKEAGQQALPKLGEDVVHEGALTLDFKPGDDAKGEFTLKAPPPGAYLIRVETQNLVEQHGHEHYAALDLVVEEGLQITN